MSRKRKARAPLQDEAENGRSRLHWTCLACRMHASIPDFTEANQCVCGVQRFHSLEMRWRVSLVGQNDSVRGLHAYSQCAISCEMPVWIGWMVFRAPTHLRGQGHLRAHAVERIVSKVHHSRRMVAQCGDVHASMHALQRNDQPSPHWTWRRVWRTGCMPPFHVCRTGCMPRSMLCASAAVRLPGGNGELFRCNPTLK